MPDFIRQYHYKTRLDEITDFFSKPPIDLQELDKLYRSVMSRLPDLTDYSYCAADSNTEKTVWRSKSGLRAFGSRDQSLYGAITITGTPHDLTVSIDHYREKGDGAAGWHDRHDIRYDVAQKSIISRDQCAILIGEGPRHYGETRWTASSAFWSGIVDRLRSSLPI